MQKQNLQELGQDDQKKLIAFEVAQNASDTASCNKYLSSSVFAKPALFCGFIEKANSASIENFLQNIGFIRVKNGGSNFHFQTLCNLNHKALICMLDRIKTFPNDEFELHTGLKILGMNLCDPSQRDSFIRIKIFANKKAAAKDLCIISNVLKMKKEPSFETAFANTIALANKDCVRLFLKKTGYMQFNRFTDEYTSYHPEKLSHLSKEVLEVVQAKANLKNYIN